MWLELSGCSGTPWQLCWGSGIRSRERPEGTGHEDCLEAEALECLKASSVTLFPLEAVCCRQQGYGRRERRATRPTGRCMMPCVRLHRCQEWFVTVDGLHHPD